MQNLNVFYKIIIIKKEKKKYKSKSFKCKKSFSNVVFFIQFYDSFLIIIELKRIK